MAKVLASYDNPAWQSYAAVTENPYGKGRAWYLGCYFSPDHLEQFVREVVVKALPAIRPHEEVFPRIIRSGYNESGHRLTYYLNYSAQQQSFVYAGEAAMELTTGREVSYGERLVLEPWGVQIVEQ